MRRISPGVLLLAGLLPFGVAAQPAPGDVVINEIMYAPSPSTNEFIELYNRSDSAVDLHQLGFADDNRDYNPVTSTDTSISPGDYVVLARDPEAFEAAFPSTDYLAPDGWNALNNTGDTVHLRHSPSDTPLDSVPYDPTWGGSTGQSLERIDPGGPSNMARNFGSSEADKGATPGAQNSIYDPDETPPSLETVQPAPDGLSLTVVFSEPLDASTVSTENIWIDTPGAPSITTASVDDASPHHVHCAVSSPLPSGTYVLVVSGISDRPGNVLDEARTSFSFFDPDAPVPGDVVVSEIMYAPSTASNEFIELYNRSDKTFDLGAFQFADEARDFAAVAPPLTKFEPESYVVLVRDPEAFEASFPDVDYLAPSGWNALNNGGDLVLLRHDPTEVSVDSIPYSPAWGGSEGQSLERIDPHAASDVSSNFASSTAPQGATPGAQNSRHDSDTTPPRPVFAEQVHETEALVIFDEPIQSDGLQPETFQFAAVTVTDVTIQADSIAHLSLSGGPRGETLVVSGVRDPRGNVLDRAQLPFAHRPESEEIVINEILFDPLADDFDNRPNQVEYIELLNLTKRPLTLNGLHLTDRRTEHGTADTTHVGRPRILPPEGFAVVAATPQGALRLRDAQLAEAFPDVHLLSDSVGFLPVPSSRLGLDNSGDLIRVHRADGAQVTEVDYDPSWHSAGLVETKGTALVRISPTADAQDGDNWTSSTSPEGGTPGAPNAVSLQVPEETSQSLGLHIQPSPFSIERDGATRIQYTLSEAPNLIRVRIYDARGREVRTLEDAQLTGQTGELVWNGRDDTGDRVRVGIYIVLFEAVRADAGTVARYKEPVVLARPLDE